MSFPTPGFLVLLLDLAMVMPESRVDASFLGGDDLDQQQLLSLDEYELTRTFDSFNSTSLLIVIAVGSVLLLGLGVALYLYDYFADTSRSEPLPSYSHYYEPEQQEQYYYR